MDPRTQLTNVLSALADVIEEWNSLAADEDRGPNHDMLVLTIWADGSGRIGTAFTYENEDDQPSNYTVDVNLQGGFNDIGGCVDLLMPWVEVSEVWTLDDAQERP